MRAQLKILRRVRIENRFRLLNYLPLAAGLWAGSAQASLEFSLPENPLAFAHCTAIVHVDAARLREGPSLHSGILGLRQADDSVNVTQITGKWAQVVLDGSDDTAYIATYLLTFPYAQLLDQWKHAAPRPSLGKKSVVKWAVVNFREYPSPRSPVIGLFEKASVVGELYRMPTGWSLVECQGGVLGFVFSSALEPAPVLPGFPDLGPPLSPVLQDADAPLARKRESPGEYLARTAWSPEVFRLQLREEARSAAAAMVAAR